MIEKKEIANILKEAADRDINRVETVVKKISIRDKTFLFPINTVVINMLPYIHTFTANKIKHSEFYCV